MFFMQLSRGTAHRQAIRCAAVSAPRCGRRDLARPGDPPRPADEGLRIVAERLAAAGLKVRVRPPGPLGEAQTLETDRPETSSLAGVCASGAAAEFRYWPGTGPDREPRRLASQIISVFTLETPGPGRPERCGG